MPVGFIAGVNKLADGAHGGFDPIDLPASIAIDYWVSGTCEFGITITSPASTKQTPVATFTMRMFGGVVSSTWPVALKPAAYFVVPAEAVGCTYSLIVRAAT
jgi:hypothetical protein